MTEEPDWSPQQREALKLVRAWLASGSQQIFRLFGFAGVGKTTIAKYVAPGMNVRFATYTGKAASVMRKKGCEDASTIDRLIYRPIIGYECFKEPPCEQPPCKPRCQHVRSRFLGRGLRDEWKGGIPDLIILDECSMVNTEMAQDLLSFGIKILVLGDPAQLPPIEGGGYFTECGPDYLLTEIHRYAGTPVLNLATCARNKGFIGYGHYGDSVVKRMQEITLDDMVSCEQVIVATNPARRYWNDKLRERKGFFDDLPEIGDRLICLKNRHHKGLYNGTMWKVVKVGALEDGFLSMEIIEDDDVEDPRTAEIEAPIWGFQLIKGANELDGDPFDYGYAITCHKAQGSQYKSVCIYDDSWKIVWTREKLGLEPFDRARWRYTAITRAENRVILGI